MMVEGNKEIIEFSIKGISSPTDVQKSNKVCAFSMITFDNAIE